MNKADRIHVHTTAHSLKYRTTYLWRLTPGKASEAELLGAVEGRYRHCDSLNAVVWVQDLFEGTSVSYAYHIDPRTVPIGTCWDLDLAKKHTGILFERASRQDEPLLKLRAKHVENITSVLHDKGMKAALKQVRECTPHSMHMPLTKDLKLYRYLCNRNKRSASTPENHIRKMVHQFLSSIRHLDSKKRLELLWDLGINIQIQCKNAYRSIAEELTE